MLLGQTHKLVHTIGRFVGHAHMAHFAGFHQLRQRFERADGTLEEMFLDVVAGGQDMAAAA